MKLPDRGVKRAIKVRFRRAWRGYRAGDVIVPPAALRQALLVQTVLGQPIIEVVEDPPVQAAGEPQDGISEDAPFLDEDPDTVSEDGETKRKRGRPRKGDTK